ncbi:MAG TPA: iron-containing alcohol dehydrogenase [Myxococcota bacterium]
MAIWSFPTRIIFGAGEIARLSDEALAVGMKRPLLVTDAGVEHTGVLAAVLAALKNDQLAVATFTGVEGNPTEDNIAAGARAYSAHRADGVIAVGGGSPMDAGKLIALRACCALSFEELDDSIDGGRHVPADVPPIITVPTTAGTGSEVGRAAVVTVRSTQRKTVVFSPRLLARVAILDPNLTRSMPAPVTAATGFDALTHCVEAYLAKGDHPMADAIALAGIDLVAKYLERAVADGNDMEARGMMMKAAMMGAVAFQKGLGACHSLAHPLSSEHGLHHGLANALLLPHVLDLNAPAIFEPCARLADTLHLRAQDPVATIRDWVVELVDAIGLPARAPVPGADEALVARLAALVPSEKLYLATNPRPASAEEIARVYRAVLGLTPSA